MGSLVLALVASLAFIAATSSRAVADTSDTQVTLTCNDGHSVTAAVDSTTLLQLTAEVQALVGDPTGLSCTLDPAGTPPASWTVYDYNPSGQAIAPRVSAASMPATTDGTTVSFPFKPNIYTALLTTRDASLTGDLSGKTLSVTVSVSGGGGTFQYQRGGSCGGPANVRFHFASPKASGTTGPGTTGFYTQFWWSNPANVPLLTDPQTTPISISAIVADPTEWSDWNGKRGDTSPEITAAFMVAIQNVQTVGLSFGGGCGFENGVTTSDGMGTFQSMFTEAP